MLICEAVLLSSAFSIYFGAVSAVCTLKYRSLELDKGIITHEFRRACHKPLRDESAATRATALAIGSAILSGKLESEAYDVGVGQSIGGEYNIHKPNDGIAYIHILLDATGSTRISYLGAERTKVWEQLLKQFEKLLRETLRPGDVVYIWAFNRTTTHLCKFEAKDLDSKSKSI